ASGVGSASATYSSTRSPARTAYDARFSRRRSTHAAPRSMSLRTAPRDSPGALSASTTSSLRPASAGATVKETRSMAAWYLSDQRCPMAYEQIRYEPGRVAALTFARPQALNAITPQLMREAADAITRAGADAAVRV